MIKKSIVFFLNLFTFSLFGQGHNPMTQDAGGFINLMIDLASPPRFDEQFGKLYFNNGNVNEGKFQIKTSKIYFLGNSDKELQKYKFNEVDSLILYPDTNGSFVKFIYLRVDKYGDLYKVIYDGNKVMLLNNYYSLGEKAEVPNDFRQLLYIDQNNCNLHNWKSMKDFFPDIEYMEGIPRTIDRISSFLTILNSVVLLLDQRKPNESHNWKEGKLILTSGESLSGYAFCQPYFSQTGSTDNRAFVHFFDGQSFKLFSNEEVREVIIDDIVYKPYYNKKSLKYVFGRIWNHQGKSHIVYQTMFGPNYYLENNIRYFSEKNFIVAEKTKKNKIKNSGKLKDLSAIFYASELNKEQ